MVEFLSEHIKNNKVSMTKKFSWMNRHQLENVQRPWARHRVDGCIDDSKSGKVVVFQINYL